jgi:hypothetical protein
VKTPTKAKRRKQRGRPDQQVIIQFVGENTNKGEKEIYTAENGFLALVGVFTNKLLSSLFLALVRVFTNKLLSSLLVFLPTIYYPVCW